LSCEARKSKKPGGVLLLLGKHQGNTGTFFCHGQLFQEQENSLHSVFFGSRFVLLFHSFAWLHRFLSLIQPIESVVEHVDEGRQNRGQRKTERNRLGTGYQETQDS
jgi:hypothetical protein